LSCRDSAKVTFDITSVEKLFLDPKAVLQDVDKFWKEETSYQMALGWAPPGYPIHIGGFRDEVEVLAKQSPEEREQNEYFLFAKKLVESVTKIREKGIPHICSYLPSDTKINATIYLASFIFLGKDKPQFVPTAFVYEGNSCLNVTSTSWKSNIDNPVHEIVHEIYHTGYSQHQSTVPLEEEMTTQQLFSHILWQLHNEGLATYVTYKVLNEFPSEEKDYDLLENPSEVARLFENVRNLIQDVRSKPPSDVKDDVIKVGISERGFYIAGAYMVQTIDEKLGKNALIESVIEGPKHFLDTYNSIAGPERVIDVQNEELL